MTREEEIKARISECGVRYVYHAVAMSTEDAGDDIRYLLARNEELQRRVWRLEAGLEEILTRKMSMASDYTHLIKQMYRIARFTLDAKEQVDVPQHPELVPVYPGPDLKRGDIVYTPNGSKAEVYNISEDAGTFTSQGQFCASVLRREKDKDDANSKE